MSLCVAENPVRAVSCKDSKSRIFDIARAGIFEVDPAERLKTDKSCTPAGQNVSCAHTE